MPWVTIYWYAICWEWLLAEMPKKPPTNVRSVIRVDFKSKRVTEVTTTTYAFAR